MIKEEELKAALNKTNLCLKYKNEVLNKLSLEGLVERSVYYGVAYDINIKRFMRYKHLKEHIDPPHYTTINNFFENENDAIELARQCNEVLNNYNTTK